MKKKIIFLDGDGTLWYPKKTLRTEKPHWIYYDPETKDNYLEHLVLTPEVKETLGILKEKGYLLIVVSANPSEESIAIEEIKNKLRYFEILNLFDSVKSSDADDPNGKGDVMLKAIAEFGLSKSDAIMIGDSYLYDYLAAKNAGIDSYFIKNTISILPETLVEEIQSIDEVSDILDILE